MMPSDRLQIRSRLDGILSNQHLDLSRPRDREMAVEALAADLSDACEARALRQAAGIRNSRAHAGHAASILARRALRRRAGGLD